jgi:transposase-like protein
MKYGGVSWNRSSKSKVGIVTKYKCQVCGRQYKQDYTKAIHEKLCKNEKNK